MLKSGDRVKMSAFGEEMQGVNKRKKEGTVIYFRPYDRVDTDGVVSVKWDGTKNDDSMHVSHVELIKKSNKK